MSNFFNELKNRNVYKAATAYVVTGWLIMQVVDTMSNNLEWPPAIASWITKILIVGFPITLVITWLYEVTPAGLKRTGKVQEDTPENRRSGKRLNHLIIGALAITICFMLVERVFFAGNTGINSRQQASIAVLPFVNMSSDEENEYFADGLTEQILDELANISSLQVPARTSSFSFKDRNEDIRRIGKLLGVNYILEGSVQYDSHGNRVKITAQLINANNGYHLWSETYEDDFKEIFSIQEDVSRKVVSRLRVQLLPEEDKILSEKPTENTDAYKLFLEARTYSQLREDAPLKKAIELLEEAIELDPNFAEAHAELSFLFYQRNFYGSLDKEISDEKMKFHIEKALELAPDKPEVIRANTIYKKQKGGYSEAELIVDLRKALEVNPNYADGHFALAQALHRNGQHEEALKAVRKTVELDPLNQFYLGQLSDKLFFIHNKHEEAFAIMDKLDSLNPNGGAHLGKALMLENEPYGDKVEAFKIRHRLLKSDPDRRFFLTHNVLGALDLDLWPLAEKYSRTIQLNYSGTFAIYNNLSHLYNFKREYSNLRELMEVVLRDGLIDPESATLEMIWVEFMLGNVEKALNTYEKQFPEVADQTILSEDLDDSSAQKVSYYVEFLRAAGKVQKADRYADKFCSYYRSNYLNNTFIPPTDQYNYALTCYYNSMQKAEFIEYLNEVYFEKRNRVGWFTYMKSGYFVMLENDPEYQKLFKKIEAETHRMRAEVIEYLKEEGDWDPAWDEELGLD